VMLLERISSHGCLTSFLTVALFIVSKCGFEVYRADPAVRGYGFSYSLFTDH